VALLVSGVLLLGIAAEELLLVSAQLLLLLLVSAQGRQQLRTTGKAEAVCRTGKAEAVCRMCACAALLAHPSVRVLVGAHMRVYVCVHVCASACALVSGPIAAAAGLLAVPSSTAGMVRGQGSICHEQCGWARSPRHCAAACAMHMDGPEIVSRCRAAGKGGVMGFSSSPTGS